MKFSKTSCDDNKINKKYSVICTTESLMKMQKVKFK